MRVWLANSCNRRFASPHQLEPELNLARRGGSRSDHACRGGRPARGRCINDGIGTVEIRAIEQVEKLGAELHVQALRD
jgi:hypothetical protein